MAQFICLNCKKEFNLKRKKMYCSRYCTEQYRWKYKAKPKRKSQFDITWRFEKMKSRLNQFTDDQIYKSFKKTKAEILKQGYSKEINAKLTVRIGVIKYSKSTKGKKTLANWKDKNKNKLKELGRKYFNKRSSEDPIYKLTNNMRRRLRLFVSQSKTYKKADNTFKMIGCEPNQLKKYLEKKFKPGMTWENHGIRGWHIDHIKPLASAKSIEEFNRLCHYTNLQPLWAKENLKKSDKY